MSGEQALQGRPLERGARVAAVRVGEEGEILQARYAANAGYYDQGLLAIHHFFELEADDEPRRSSSSGAPLNCQPMRCAISSLILRRR